MSANRIAQPLLPWGLFASRHSGALWSRRLLIAMLAIPVLLPCLWLLGTWTAPQPEVWTHLARHVLPNAAWQTLALASGVAAFVLLLGTSSAWLVARFDFPGRNILQWALLLPLALPPYVMAFAWLGLVDYFGLPATLLRAAGIEAWPMLSLHGVPGAVWVLGLVLYPYVFLLLRESFAQVPRSLVESGRLMSLGPWALWWRVWLPLARPALALGLVLVLMETIAEFGAVAALGVNSFTVAIYRTWFSLQNLSAAAQLASLLLLVVGLLVLFEAHSRRRRSFASRRQSMPRRRLSPAAGWLATLWLGTILLLGFGLPLAQLIDWARQSGLNPLAFVEAIENTLLLGAMAALSVLVLALLLAIAERRAARDPTLGHLAALANLGYAVPGTVMAVGLMFALNLLERLAPGNLAGGVLASGVLALLLAYQARFLRIGYSPLAAALTRLRPSVVEAAQGLGLGPLARLWRLHLPLLRPAVLASLLLVFVEVLKELPATLILRPFGWDTLATRIFAYTSEGQWQMAAWPALLLVGAGLLPVILLATGSDRSPQLAGGGQGE